MSVVSQSLVAHALLGAHIAVPHIFLVAFLALAAGTAVNYVTVGLAISLLHGYSPWKGMATMKMGTVTAYAVTYASWGLLGAMSAVLYAAVSLWALPAFLAPVLVGRQALSQSQRSLEVSLAYEARESAVREISRQVQSEREDERRLIAADLHDEILQPLYTVEVMAQVVKHDLASGRLFELERDVRDLVRSADAAGDLLRSRIGNLRESNLGSGGLRQALQYLVASLQTQTRAHLTADIQAVHADASCELIAYQVAKEALSNAVAHSGASQIRLTLALAADELYLVVEDDGRGFDPATVPINHYGLLIMRERAAAASGELYIDSSLGQGTRVTLHLPRFAGTTEKESLA